MPTVRAPPAKVLRALSARFLFATHGLICIWRVASVYQDWKFWALGFLLILIFLEGAVAIWNRKGDETRWFCVSVFLYLCAVVPSLWFLQLELCRKSIRDLELNKTVVTATASIAKRDLSGESATFDFWTHSVTIYIPIEREVWVQLLQQTMLVIVILGRWILPKGDISRDHLSQLLLVFLAMAADMVELFDTFKENQVKYNMRLTCLVLIVWNVSIIQFPLVLTGRSSRKPRLSTLKRYSNWTLQQHPFNNNTSYAGSCSNAFPRSSHSSSVHFFDPNMAVNETSFCYWLTTDINFWGFLSSTILQDAPFLATRLYLLIKHQTISYPMIFFTCKNTLVVALQCYRLLVICSETRKRVRDAKDNLLTQGLLNAAACLGGEPQRRISEFTETIAKLAARNSRDDAMDIGGCEDGLLQTPAQTKRNVATIVVASDKCSEDIDFDDPSLRDL